MSGQALAAFVGGVVAMAALAGCDRALPPEGSLPAPPDNLGETIPSPPHNPMTAAGVALGRRLFFDPRLSGDDRIACASCHDPERAYSDPRPASVGASGEPLPRNAPPLINLAWHEGYFWDGGAKNLESQIYGPLTSPDEMDQDLDELLDELRADDSYPAMFAAAFSDGITLGNLARAIAQFERSLVSASSRYDRFVRGEPGGGLSDLEQQGLALVRAKCSPCHTTDLFTDGGYHNNGLDPAFAEDDERLAWGRGRISRDPRDLGKYKTPTLRNLARTAPYMHDGRFDTLPEVLEHYRGGVVASPTLDEALRRGDALGIALDDDDVAAILAFLRTLDDAP